MTAEGGSAAGLEGLVRDAQKAAADPSYVGEGLQVLAFFDLSGSSRAKLIQGNVVASRNAVAFTNLASSLSSRAGGRVLKTLGDGALAMFTDPIAACRAALELRHATHDLLHLEMTAGITSGRPIRVPLGEDGFDVLGDAVDRAARIQSLASPGQVLIDSTLRMQVRADLAGRPEWRCDAEPRFATAKGIGELQLYELWVDGQWRPKEQLATPFEILVGRPSLSQKLSLVRYAKTEIVEIGIGLTSFAQYFTGQSPEEFRDPIRQLVRGGVELNCFALNPSYGPGQAWLGEQGNADYPDEAAIARRRIEDEAKFCRNEQYLGRVGYHTYSRVPEFWCLGVDVNDPLDGRMFFAPYLMGVPRASMPVVQVSRSSRPDLYAKYLSSVHELRAASDDTRR